MTMLTDHAATEGPLSLEGSNPFAEAVFEEPLREAASESFTPWTEQFTPFAESLEPAMETSATEQRLLEALAELRDEAFDEAVAALAAETEGVVAERFSDESIGHAQEREQYADSHLSGLRFEAEQYLDRLMEGLAGTDVESLADQQLDELLDSFDPETSEVTPAGEEFLGALVRKAKGLVKFVAKTAKSVGQFAGKLLGPILGRLKALISPLLRRVLAFAVGRLPAALRPAARMLAARITSEAEGEGESEEANVSPALLVDPHSLAEMFDVQLAKAVVSGADRELGEAFLAEQSETEVADNRSLEYLAEARGQLLDTLKGAHDGENLVPAMEQFIPALLGALRLGINLVGRPKVVGFLAGYLGKLISRWVGPTLSSPLSNAIVDTGLRLISLETPEVGERMDEAAPAMLASVVEDTVRRLAESEEYVFEDEELTELATAEAFSQAVAAAFPARLVRPALQPAPSLGGSFVVRRPRAVRTYRRYSQAPEIEITERMADALPSFGGTTVGAVLRAAGVRLPLRARVHLFEAMVGTSLSRIAQLEPVGGFLGAAARFHPLTEGAATLLFREPALGVQVPGGYLQSPYRVAVGQRFYAFEPISPVSATIPYGGSVSHLPIARRPRPSRALVRVDQRLGRVAIAFYLSEDQAQAIAAAVRTGRGPAALLTALNAAYTGLAPRPGGVGGRVFRGEDESEAVLLTAASLGHRLHRRLRRWLLPAMARWARMHGEEFARATASAASGVTVVATVQLPRVGNGHSLRTLRGSVAPMIAIRVVPGRQRP